MVFDVYDLIKCYKLIMFIIDIVIKEDLEFCKIVECFCVDLVEFELVFVKVWFKLNYCDLGLCVCYLGDEVFVEVLVW